MLPGISLSSYLELVDWPARLGRYCETSAEPLKAIAEKRGVHHVDNALSSLATG
jgi:hypothetical protein